MASPEQPQVDIAKENRKRFDFIRQRMRSHTVSDKGVYQVSTHFNDVTVTFRSYPASGFLGEELQFETSPLTDGTQAPSPYIGSLEINSGGRIEPRIGRRGSQDNLIDNHIPENRVPIVINSFLLFMEQTIPEN